MPVRLAALAASAAAFGLYAQIEWPWTWLGWVGLVPFLWALDRTASPRAALGLGLLMAVAFTLAVFAWFAPAIAGYAGAPWVIGLGVLVVLAPLLEPQLVVLALVRHLVGQRAGAPRAALAGACAYVGTEWASPKLFGDTLGHGLYASSLMRQAADLAGAPGLTLVLVLANECALAALRELSAGRARRALGPATAVLALAAALLGYGVVRTRQLAAVPQLAPVTAGIIQADVSQYDRLAAAQGTFATVRAILDQHFALSGEARARAGLDLLVWPETVYPTTFGSPKSEEGRAFDREIAAFVAQSRVPLVFGSYDVEDGDEFNAAVFLEPAADARLEFETYRKASLFPLTERVPRLLELPALRARLPWLGTWKAGPGGEVVPLALADGRRLRVAPLICYDALTPALALAAVRRGADVIVTLSNDSWFATGPGPRLHLIGAAFRSLETRRPQVRATNTGISALIAPTGELLAVAGVHERAVLVGAVSPVRDAWTLVLAWGDWLGPVACGLGAALLAAAFLTGRAAQAR